MKRAYAFLSILPMVIILLFASSCTTYADKNECPVEVQPLSNANSTVIRIESVVDTLTVYNVKLNRGNAKLDSLAKTEKDFPITLKFGEFFSVITWTPSVREIKIQTDQGDWTFRKK